MTKESRGNSGGIPWPFIHDDPGFVAAAEGFHVQALVTEHPVEALADAVLSAASELELEGLAALAAKPVLQALSEEFPTTVVAANEAGPPLA